MNQKLIDQLNAALRMEYSDIFLYPRHSDFFKSHPAIAELFKNFSQMEVRHADILANEIHKIGGYPDWDFQLLTAKMTLPEIVKWHLASEHNSVKHYQKCINLATDKRLKEILDGIRIEESIHEAALNKISKWI